ncbi:hypothetical protein CLU79DRAFT_884190 [Phycomyces nitens]|nr:hypothetical protein CLU79DRAFT_884190 [Phycomyces nitens]
MVTRWSQDSARAPTCMNPLAQDDIRCPPARVLSRRAPFCATSGEYTGYCGPVATAGGFVASTGGPVASTSGPAPSTGSPVASAGEPFGYIYAANAYEQEYKRGSTTSGKAQSWVTPTVKKSSRIWAQPRVKTHYQESSEALNPAKGVLQERTPTHVLATPLLAVWSTGISPIKRALEKKMYKVICFYVVRIREDIHYACRPDSLKIEWRKKTSIESCGKANVEQSGRPILDSAGRLSGGRDRRLSCCDAGR